MDAHRFDALTKALIAGVGRRRFFVGLLGGPLANLLGGRVTEVRSTSLRQKRHATAADRARDRQRDAARSSGRVSDEKKKKKKKKKKNLSPGAECVGGCSDCKTCLDGVCVSIEPLCNQAACQAAECDAATGTWRCTDGCAEIGGECCAGACLDPCPSGQTRQESDCNCRLCPDLRQWGDVRGGRLEYVISYWARKDTTSDVGYWRIQIDQTANGWAELECEYFPNFGDIRCHNLGGSISGTHRLHDESYNSMDTISPLDTRDEYGSGAETLSAGPWPGLEIHLPNAWEDPNLYMLMVYTINVQGTWEENSGDSGTDEFEIPRGWQSPYLQPDLTPLPSTPQPLSGKYDFVDTQLSWDNLTRVTWTFTPQAC